MLNLQRRYFEYYTNIFESFYQYLHFQGSGFFGSESYEQIEPRRLIRSKKFTQIANGENFTLALCNEGRLYGWGTSFSGKDSSSLEPVLIGTGDKRFVKVFAGLRHAAAVDAEGLAYSWGFGGSWYKGGGHLGMYRRFLRNNRIILHLNS